MINIKKLTVSYQNKEILKDIDLDFNKDMIHGIVGLNGAGKTTLLRSIYGLKDIDKGEVIINFEKSTKPIAFLETMNYFYPKINGYEYLKFINNGKNENIDLLNTLFNLPLKKLIEYYSTGMKKKLAFLGVLSLQRPILFLDEPFNGIDLESYETMKHIIPELHKKGKLIIITSHILESLTSICDCIHVLNNKKIIKTYFKNEFNQIESDLFKDKDYDLTEILNKL
jgi:ABC-2 type transport system ATP-binding protein